MRGSFIFQGVEGNSVLGAAKAAPLRLLPLSAFRPLANVDVHDVAGRTHPAASHCKRPSNGLIVAAVTNDQTIRVDRWQLHSGWQGAISPVQW